MPERGEYTRKVRALTNDTLTVLSDIDNGYALSVGLVMWLGDEVRVAVSEVRSRHRTLPGQRDMVRADTGDVRLDHSGTVIGRKVDPDFRSRMDMEEILRTLGQS